MSVWQGREDAEEATPAKRWHQVMLPLDDVSWTESNVLLGFACDEGVRRNKGRLGASDGPKSIRGALANLSYQGDNPIYDAGDVVCYGDQMEAAQAGLSSAIEKMLASDMHITVLGGGHEIAWASHQGIMKYLGRRESHTRSSLPESASLKTLGIINFDAHLDLRNPAKKTSSGTPFRQIAQWCETHQEPFHYHVIGVNPSANTNALFDYARQHRVTWIEDVDTHIANLEQVEQGIEGIVAKVDFLYVTICLDVFQAAIAPGVSAPAAVGVSSEVVIHAIRCIKRLSKEYKVPIILRDIAEMNPHFDQDQRTAKLAARMVWELN
jgi:formiminoglutamase